MTAQPRHAQDPYAQFYGPDAQETAAWLNGAEWATDPETREAFSILACECDDYWPCPGCGACLTCGPESVRCDVDGRHCEMCVDGCLTCKRERRPA